MVNEMRTLLLNEPASAVRQAGDQYVPADFIARVLPSSLAVVRNALLGSRSDRIYKNWRLQEICACVAVTDLYRAPYVTDLRTTYDPRDNELGLLYLRGLTLARIGGNTTSSVVIAGAARGTETQMTLRHDGTLRVPGDGTAQFGGRESVSLNFTNGLSQSLAVPGTSVRVVVQENTAGLWSISGYVRPQTSLVTVLENLVAILAVTETNLFTGDTTPLGDVWAYDDRDYYRVAAIAIALSQRIAEIS